MYQTSDPTWQAYNSYGGASFYQGGTAGRAFKVSYNRPFATRGDASTARDFYFGAEFPLVRFLERNGYDVSYLSGVDTDRRGALLKNHRVFISAGHDEYWSGAQRANIQSARDAGVNLQFLSGNEGYWRTRYENSPVDGGAYRTLVSYKETLSNAKIDPSNEWTGTWRDPRFATPANGGASPENALTGTAYVVNDGLLPVTVNADEGRTRLWRNTSLTSLSPGTKAELAPNTVGYESDEDLFNGFRPPGLIRLSTTVGDVPQYLQDFGNTVRPGRTTHHLTMYRASSRALVFSAGSIQWSWGLDATHDGLQSPSDQRMQQAQINLLADMGAQPTTLMSGLVAAQASTDDQAPTVTITSRPPQSVQNGRSYTVAGSAVDTGGGVVAGVEYSTDGGVSWSPATGTTSWTFSYIQHGLGPASVRVRAIDDSANTDPTGTVVSVDVASPASIFGDTVPQSADSGDPSAVELGLRFSVSRDGYLAGARFYKSVANTGTHIGSLWSANGARLAQATFTGETASGWQEVRFSTPVQVTAGTTYTVSYSTTSGRYAYEPWAFAYGGLSREPFQVAGGAGSASAGVYGAIGSMPTSSYQNTNYSVDAIFEGAGAVPLATVDQYPLNTAVSVAVDSEIRAVLNKPVDPATVSIVVRDAAGAQASGATTWDGNTRTATFKPSQALQRNTQYTVTVGAKDAAGQSLTSGASWSFRTVKPDTPPGTCPCSLYQDSTRPALELVDDSSLLASGQRLTLGTRFTTVVPGAVTGLRFYKAAGMTGTHIGTLFSADGTALSTVTVSSETASGWQQATFNAPVQLSPGVDYVIALSGNGTYSATPGDLDAAKSVGPLRTGARAGAFSYGGAFPNNASSTSYLVDPVFAPAPSAASVSVTATSPANGAADTTPGPLSIRFSQPVLDGYTFRVTAGANAIAGTTRRSADGTSLTFEPTGALPAATVISASVENISAANGAKLARTAWTFSTASAAGNPTTLLGNSVPAVTDAADPAPVSLGVQLSTSRPIDIRALRFYKGSKDSAGSHTATLWDSAGNSLATAKFTDETASGWQTAVLDRPVRLPAGSMFTVSYQAVGGYAYTGGAFSAPISSGPLTSTTPNGRYSYGQPGGLPLQSWNATNYFTDLVFSE
ncbi:hypothetical protein BKD30_10790 [Tersicoccus phoenicis]|uniref:Ig-like domain-containing protein n=1 Tax=Tersicoccus phoenicis TaxID=554083 RepID=A0A1R1L8H3_9MICC|nr:hypothetical protein BKD30_10790 [Tersicoccus phoenicis]